MKTSGQNFKGGITYDNLVINLGYGFDAESGTFVVPVSGTYRMSFSGQSALGKYEPVVLYVQMNGSRSFRIWDSNEAEKADSNNVSYTWLMNLRKDDRVNLHSQNDLYAFGISCLTFTGELIHIWKNMKYKIQSTFLRNYEKNSDIEQFF